MEGKMSENPVNNQKYLLEQQYKRTDNFTSRTDLHEKYTITDEPWFSFVYRYLNLQPDQKVLELGSGTGLLWQKNFQVLPENCEIHLTDLSEGMLDSIQNSIQDKRFHFKQMDAQNITYPDATFDTVIANHMLYHVPDFSKTMREIKRVLKPGGKLIAATNGNAHMTEIYDFLYTFDPTHGFQRRILPFNLDSGTELLKAEFSHVEQHIHASYLRITEVTPLVAYYRSMQTLGVNFALYNQQAFSEFLQTTLDNDGQIIVHKSQGLFIARN
jgi:ubiquinone/menaquinone biosynthesis C-methylase UbiE